MKDKYNNWIKKFNFIFWRCLGFALDLAALGLEIKGQITRIKIDVERRVGEIDPKIYGIFIEHVGG